MKGIQQDKKSLYIMMEYVEGGELYKIVQQKGKLELDQAKFYAAQIILAFEHMHGK
jgi:serine/threonine protein kinase